MTRMRFSVLLIALSIAWARGPLAQSAESIHGWLHTSGRQILDERGHAVRFRGVNLAGMEWGAGPRTRGSSRCSGAASNPGQGQLPARSWGWHPADIGGRSLPAEFFP